MNRDELKDHLRAVDPGLTEMIDALRTEFPGLKLVHIRTDQVEIGTPTDPARLVEMSDSVPVAQIQAAWMADAALAADMHNRQRGFKVKPRGKK